MTSPTPTVVPSSDTRRRLAITIGTAAACLLMVTACDGSEATPPPSPTPSSSTPATTTPSTPATTPKPPPPTMPAAASAGFTVSSAEAFARFYLAAADHAALTGDTSLVRRWANKTCTVCAEIAAGYEKQYKAGGSIVGDVRYTIDRVDQARLAGNNLAEIRFSGHVGRFVDRDSATATPNVFPGGKVGYRLGLLRSQGNWSMYGMVINE